VLQVIITPDQVAGPLNFVQAIVASPPALAQEAA
jgi:hypothetical protein